MRSGGCFQPEAIAGQASSCAGVAPSGNVSSNHARTGAEKPVTGLLDLDFQSVSVHASYLDPCPTSVPGQSHDTEAIAICLVHEMSNLLEAITLIDLMGLTHALDLLQLNARTNGFMMAHYRELIPVVMINRFAPVAVGCDGSARVGTEGVSARPTVVIP